MTTLIIFILSIVFFVIYFGRTPARLVPANADIVSPANGTIIAIDEVNTEHITFLKEGIQNELEARGVTLPAHVLVIQMNLRDVHVQRAPIDGVVTEVQHFDGKFKNALYGKNRAELVNANEKNLIVISNQEETIAVIQVAGILARRIRSYVHVDDGVEQGQKIGFIMLGSQVVLVIPSARDLKVKVGDMVVDGETVIAQ